MYPESFEKYWLTTATRNGKRLGKRNTYREWQKIIKTGIESEILENASLAYAKFCKTLDRFPKDPERFLKHGTWEDFTEEQSTELEMVTVDAVTARDYYSEIGRQNIVDRIERGDAPQWALIVPEKWLRERQ